MMGCEVVRYRSRFRRRTDRPIHGASHHNGRESQCAPSHVSPEVCHMVLHTPSRSVLPQPTAVAPNGSRLSCGALKKESFLILRAPPASSAC